MLVPCQKTVVILDPMAFRRARVESFLKPWAEDENVLLISLQPELARARLIESKIDMLICDVGGSCPSAVETLTQIQVLPARHPTAALVILADDIGQASIAAAMNSGARGYLDNSMAPDLAMQALSFVLHGGTYFPLAGILATLTASDTSVDFPQDAPRAQSSLSPRKQGQLSIAGHGCGSLQQQSFLLDEQETCVLDGIQSGRAHHDIPELQLTQRQKAILYCLCRGDANKVIARTCHIAESTVKIHLKSILRKIHVKNRTQAAIWAIQHGLEMTSDPSGIFETNNPSHNVPKSVRLR